jgi:DnaK suppressor protein
MLSTMPRTTTSADAAHEPSGSTRAASATVAAIPAAAPEAPGAPKTARPKKAAVTKDAAPAADRKVAPLQAPARVPAKATGGYTEDEAFLSRQRELLLQERATYVEQAQSLRAEAESLVEEMEPGDIQFDEESGEGGTVTVDRERDLALSAQALAAVEEIDGALLKIERGTYGVCESCGELIPAARLEALPYARLCIACKSGGLSRR